MFRIEHRYFCDICKTEITDTEFLRKNYDSNDGLFSGKKIMVIFTTEQTEGKPVEPYIAFNYLHLCPKCLNEIIKNGKQVYAFGAQGNNIYYFKKNNGGN